MELTLQQIEQLIKDGAMLIIPVELPGNNEEPDEEKQYTVDVNCEDFPVKSGKKKHRTYNSPSLEDEANWFDPTQDRERAIWIYTGDIVEIPNGLDGVLKDKNGLIWWEVEIVTGKSKGLADILWIPNDYHIALYETNGQ